MFNDAKILSLGCLQVDSTAATLLSAADGSSVAAVRGLTALAEAALPSQLSLLPDELSSSLPDRCTAPICSPAVDPSGFRQMLMRCLLCMSFPVNGACYMGLDLLLRISALVTSIDMSSAYASADLSHAAHS